jgi:hypothetical protein
MALKELEQVDLRQALADLIDGVKREVDHPDHRGGSGYLLARLSDAEAALHRFDLAAKAKRA